MASDLDSQQIVEPAGPPGRAVALAPILWFGVLLIIVYAPVLYRLIQQWSGDADMGHGFFVPLVAGYIAWLKRDTLLATEAVSNRWGLLVVAWGAAQLMVATLGVELFLARTAFLVSLIGVLLYLGGAQRLKVLAYPLFLLFFMVPIPAIVYNQITFPLQLLASQLAERALSLLGIPVFREGNILELANQRLSVVEACSGIRSLLSLSFLSLVYAYFFDSKVWMRWALLVATVPIAIIANAFRVTITGVLSSIRRDLAEGFFHSAEGWVIFMVALLILILVHQVINRVHGAWHARR
jgi:exosortase